MNTARLGLINAKNNVRLRTIALYNAMGIDPGGDIEVEDILAQTPEVPSLNQIEKAALENRPEMQKAAADIQAAQARVRAAESNYLPTLSANAAYNWANGSTLTPLTGAGSMATAAAA